MTTPTNNKLLFSFEDMSAKDKAAKLVSRHFRQAGAQVVQSSADPRAKRSSGISYREMTLTFADSQTVVLRIKSTGDVYQVVVNGSITPIKNQDNHVAAIGEIAAMMDKGRTKFQAKLAKAAVKPPPGITTTAPKMKAVLTERRDNLIAAIAEVRADTADMRARMAA